MSEFIRRYDFDAIKEPDKKRLSIEALRLVLADALCNLTRAQDALFDAHCLSFAIYYDYGLSKTVEFCEDYEECHDGISCPFWDENAVLKEMRQKITKLLLLTSEYGVGPEEDQLKKKS